jgi:hypothetical protein
MKKRFKNLALSAVLGWLLNSSTAAAMDRWTALSLLESGNNDAAIGPAGEVSRFQIKPRLWAEFFGEDRAAAPTNPRVALRVAQAIMRERCAAFERRFHRPPTNFEYYVLWNAPCQVRKPGKAVTERADRFCNLVGA